MIGNKEKGFGEQPLARPLAGVDTTAFHARRAPKRGSSSVRGGASPAAEKRRRSTPPPTGAAKVRPSPDAGASAPPARHSPWASSTPVGGAPAALGPSAPAGGTSAPAQAALGAQPAVVVASASHDASYNGPVAFLSELLFRTADAVMTSTGKRIQSEIKLVHFSRVLTESMAAAAAANISPSSLREVAWFNSLYSEATAQYTLACENENKSRDIARATVNYAQSVLYSCTQPR
jgi:hypothetical protein